LSKPEIDPADLAPKDPEQMQDVRASISAKGRANRRKLTEEVNVDDESLAALGLAETGRSPSDTPDETEALAAMVAEAQGEEITRKPAKKADDPVDVEYVDVVVYDRTHKVPKRDIDAAGGLKAYQMNRASNVRFQQAAAIKQKSDRQLQEIKAREEELARREKELSQHTSRNPSSVPDEELPDQGAQEKAVERSDKVKSIVDRIFSGKEEDAARAVEEILDSVEARPSLSADAVAKMVLEQLHSEQRQQQTSQRSTEQDEFAAMQEDNRKRVNHTMRTEYADVMANPLKKNLALLRYQHLVNDPNNAGRDPADIAREAGDQARKVMIDDPDAELENRRAEKRNMPRETSARQTVTPQQEKRPPSVKSHIERLRQRAALSTSSGE